MSWQNAGRRRPRLSPDKLSSGRLAKVRDATRTRPGEALLEAGSKRFESEGRPSLLTRNTSGI
jgi:hypothetical protein